MPFTGILGEAGMAKESVLGTFVAPTRFMRFVPPFNFSDDIELLESAGVRGIPDAVTKAAQGAGQLKGGKIDFEIEPENIGEHLMAAFGTDTIAEQDTFVVSNANNKIDFTEDGGSELTATLTNGTYIMGTTSATAGTLCALVKAQMEAVNPAATYTVTYSYTTKKVTITKNAGVFVLLWGTGTNAATSARTLLGWTSADTASAIAQTSASTTQQFAMQHTFTRLASSQLPSYSWWQKNGVNYPQFAGCMLSKLEITGKAKEFVMASAEWVGLKYVDGGTSQVETYSTLQPFKFDQAVLSIAGSPSYDYEEFKLTLDNMVDVVHVVGNGIYGSKLYSKGFKVNLGATLIMENATEFAKFLAGTDSSLGVAITSSENIVGSTPYSLGFTLPAMKYSAAPLPIPSDLVKIAFGATGIYDTSTTKTLSAALVNADGSAY